MNASRPPGLTDFLQREHILLPLEAESVPSAVRALVQRMVETGAVAHPERLERLTSDERIRDVIHVGERVLLPHLRTDAVERIVVAIGVAPQPLREVQGGGQGTERIVAVVLAPPDAAQVYLQLVAALARVLRTEGTIDHLLSATSPDEVLEIAELRDLALQPRLTVRDVMAQRVFRVFPDTSLQELLNLMTRHNLKAVPVVGEKREVLGMVTERDLLKHMHPRIGRSGGAPAGGGKTEGSDQGALVRDLMSRSVMCVSEDQSLADAVATMLNKDVERFPVVSEGKLTGFLTRGDILRKLFGN
jgi:CBS domain-containing protein